MVNTRAILVFGGVLLAALFAGFGVSRYLAHSITRATRPLSGQLERVAAAIEQVGGRLSDHSPLGRTIAAIELAGNRLDGLAELAKSRSPSRDQPSILRAAQLGEGQFLVDGVKGDLRGPPEPVRLLGNFPGAERMRFGNTPRELELASWRPYASEVAWYLRTGPGAREVFAEFGYSDGVLRKTSALAPPHDDALGFDYSFPLSSAIQDPRLGDLVVRQEFEEGADLWVSYDDNGGSRPGANVFYPASWSPGGGVRDTGYIWADGSRWRIDAPENPDSILALLTYPGWIDRLYSALDLSNTVARFYLRGDGLELHGAQAFFWVLDENGRWYRHLQPLVIGESEWAENGISLSTRESDWENTWARDNIVRPLDLTKVVSYGIAFRGFPLAQKVQGELGLDEFEIRRSGPSPSEARSLTSSPR
jgi:hypothetical protein